MNPSPIEQPEQSRRRAVVALSGLAVGSALMPYALAACGGVGETESANNADILPAGNADSPQASDGSAASPDTSSSDAVKAESPTTKRQQAADPTPSNRVLANRLAVIDEFHALSLAPIARNIPIYNMPNSRLGLVGHIQGVALVDRGQFFSSTADDGVLIRIDNGGGVSKCLIGKCENAAYHLGGIQAIGDHVAVPIYKENGTTGGEVRFYSYSGSSLQEHEHLRLRLGDRHPYCVGIANVELEGNNHYILAIGVDEEGREVRFYSRKSDSFVESDTTNDNWWQSDQYVTWWLDRGTLEHRRYRNNISLVADGEGALYFIGMHNHRGGISRSNRDVIDLFEVSGVVGSESATKTVHPVLTCSETVRLTRKAHSGVSFRYGASVRVTKGRHLELVASAMHTVRTAENPLGRLDIDVLSGGTDE